MENRKKAVNLFKYIMELHAQKYPIVVDIFKQEWFKFIENFETDKENIKISYIDKNSEENDFLVEISKPEFDKIPKLPKILETWLEDSWIDFNLDLVIIPEKIISENNELFENDPKRKEAFEKFKIEHETWAKKQKLIEKTRNLFNDLYLKYIELQRDSESLELMLGQGLLECEAEKKIKHPILLKKVALEFDALNNRIKIIDTDSEPEIYTGLLQNISFINHSVIKNFKDDLTENFYHPFEKIETTNFLKSLAHSLHPESEYIEDTLEKNTSKDSKLIIKNSPVFFIRKRTSGVVKSIEEIIRELEEGKEISGPLLNLIGESVSQYSEEKKDEDISESLAAISGEDRNILLSKEANREQLEIAKRIEKYNAVLVQGPPGTGKTHTITNLMGHFLAQGKNILVTSHTKKALSIIKEKLNPELQNLCVSVLDDNNKDMERSIDGITEYISSHSATELLKKSEELTAKRNQIIDELDSIRKEIFKIKFKEFETVTVDGETFNPSQAAKFIFDNKENLDYIPGKININEDISISDKDIEFLYKTNELISQEEEKDLGTAKFIKPNLLISPKELNDLINNNTSSLDENKAILRKLNEKKVELDYKNKNLIISGKSLAFSYDEENLNILKAFLEETKVETESNEEWQNYAILDGKSEGPYKNIWLSFSQKIEDAFKYASDNINLTFGKNIAGTLNKSNASLQTLNEMKEHLLKGKKLNSFSFFKPKDWMKIYEDIKINGNSIETVEDCDTLIALLSLDIKRDEFSRLWYELIEKKGGVSFKNLGDEPEQKAFNYAKKIKNCINWYELSYPKIQTLIENASLNPETIIGKINSNPSLENIKNLLKNLYDYLPRYIDLLININSKSNVLDSKYENSKNIFTNEQLETSILYRNLFEALEEKNIETYSSNYKKLEEFSEKIDFIDERQRILKLIKDFAPEWAEEIKNRKGIHGKSQAPINLPTAIKLKKLSAILESIGTLPFEEFQNKSISLSKELRKVTAELSENLAWYNLFLRIEKDISQKQALQGWKLTVKKIGKGTGKTAPALRREAKKLMAKCQTAVPAWVMPINKALESLDPKINKFDIVIIDEASQSDISALAILYLAKKIIIVGDDEQVSPSAVGLDIDKMTYLSNMYIKDLIPNSHLYDMKSSLYDIAKTTFPTLMLREHFRCVPDIIGYSNKLSYEYKIKALRDDSFVPVKPATISYYLKDAVRDNKKKINEKEAETIVALMKACMEFEEYKNMSFGAISLLGDEQANRINSLAIEKIGPLDYEKRKILCGNASQFQGDERDIVFLSLVDNNEGESQLRITGEGTGKATKQRYNVAVSRAKNQLWVVHSLDIAKDLKPGDMRRDLIEYVENPKIFRNFSNNTKISVESQLEISIANELKKLEYNVVQDWRVGSYRIDMVIVSKNKKIAIECDGDIHNYGKEYIRNDMEKQAVLERLGWKFIRIRGSEYYKNPESIIKNLTKKLKEFEIEAANKEEVFNENLLKEKVIARADEILAEWNKNIINNITKI